MVIATTRVTDLVESVLDPELPALTIGELGMVRAVSADETEIVVTLTPTFIGCPAIDSICDDIRSTLNEHGVAAPVRIALRHDPPWTTDWMSDDARTKLEEYGIAPPGLLQSETPFIGIAELAGSLHRVNESKPACPQCGSAQTEQVSMFGAAACRSHWRCTACLEPFDRFKTVRPSQITSSGAR